MPVVFAVTVYTTEDGGLAMGPKGVTWSHVAPETDACSTNPLPPVTATVKVCDAGFDVVVPLKVNWATDGVNVCPEAAAPMAARSMDRRPANKRGDLISLVSSNKSSGGIFFDIYHNSRNEVPAVALTRTRKK